MGKWVSDARAAEAESEADGNDSDSEDEDAPVRPGRAPVPPGGWKWKKKTLAQLFGAATKERVSRLSQKEIDAEADLMVALADAEALADADEDGRPDDGAVEIDSEEEYNP